MNIRTIGRREDNDLVLDHTSVAPVHARAELAPDGTLFVTSSGSHAPLHLVRDQQVLAVRRISLCVDDRVKFGQEEVGLSRLTALFDPAAGARLHHRKEPVAVRQVLQEPAKARVEDAASPRRNPDTGTIEN